MNTTLLSVGHGYSAAALARRLGGWRIIGTTRRAEKAERLRAAGTEPMIWPGEDLRPAIAAASHLLISVAPDETGDPVLRDLADAIGDAAPQLRWVGYLSTTGVYGDHAGGGVDETTALTLDPARQGARPGRKPVAGIGGSHRLLHIFRLAAPWPGRGPFEKVKQRHARRIIRENRPVLQPHPRGRYRRAVLAASIAIP